MSELSELVIEMRELERSAELALEAAREQERIAERQRAGDLDRQAGALMDKQIRGGSLLGPQFNTPGMQPTPSIAARPSLSRDGALAPLAEGIPLPSAQNRLAMRAQGPMFAGMEGTTREEVRKALEAEMQRAKLALATSYGARLRSATSVGPQLSMRDMVHNPIGALELLSGNVSIGNLKDATELGGAAAGRLGANRIAGFAQTALGVFPSVAGAAVAAHAIRGAAWKTITDAQSSDAAKSSLAAQRAQRAAFAGTRGDSSFTNFTRDLAEQLNASADGIKGKKFFFNPFTYFGQDTPTAFEKKIMIEESRRQEFSENASRLAGDAIGRILLRQQGLDGSSELKALEGIRAEVRKGNAVDVFGKLRLANQALMEIKNRHKREEEDRELNPVRDMQYRNREKMMNVQDRQYAMGFCSRKAW